jgi:hypothetical protein
LSNDRRYEGRELLTRIATGDEEAFRQIYDQYRKRIYSYAYNLTESKDRAGEVVQEVFVKLWLNRARLPEISNFTIQHNSDTKKAVSIKINHLSYQQNHFPYTICFIVY